MLLGLQDAHQRPHFEGQVIEEVVDFLRQTQPLPLVPRLRVLTFEVSHGTYCLQQLHDRLIEEGPQKVSSRDHQTLVVSLFVALRPVHFVEMAFDKAQDLVSLVCAGVLL